MAEQSWAQHVADVLRRNDIRFTGQVAARFEPKTAPGTPEVKQAVEKAIGA